MDSLICKIIAPVLLLPLNQAAGEDDGEDEGEGGAADDDRVLIVVLFKEAH